MFNKRLQHDFIIPNEGLYRVYLLEESDTGGEWPVIKGEGEPVKLPTGNPNNKIYTPILPGILTWRIVIRNQAERDVIDAVFDSIEGDYRVEYYQVEGGITENLIWRGDLLLDQYNEDLRGFPGFVEIVASDLGKLQGLSYLDIDGFPHTGRESQLQIIKNCVQLLGYDLGFACSDAIFEDTMDGDPFVDDPMLQAYADNAWYYPVDSFGQTRLMTAWDVLRSVLVSKACRIRQWGGRWHVEQIVEGVPPLPVPSGLILIGQRGVYESTTVIHSNHAVYDANDQKVFEFNLGTNSNAAPPEVYFGHEFILSSFGAPESNNRTLALFTHQGELVRKIDSTPISRGTEVLIDKDNFIYVFGNLEANGLRKLDIEFNEIWHWQNPDVGFRVSSFDVYPDGDVAIVTGTHGEADSGSTALHVIDKDKNELWSIPRIKSDWGLHSSGRGWVRFDMDKNVHVATAGQSTDINGMRGLFKFNPFGSRIYEKYIGEGTTMRALAVDNDNNVYYRKNSADAGGGRLRKRSPDGTLLKATDDNMSVGGDLQLETDSLGFLFHVADAGVALYVRRETTDLIAVNIVEAEHTGFTAKISPHPGRLVSYTGRPVTLWGPLVFPIDFIDEEVGSGLPDGFEGTWNTQNTLHSRATNGDALGNKVWQIVVQSTGGTNPRIFHYENVELKEKSRTQNFNILVKVKISAVGSGRMVGIGYMQEKIVHTAASGLFLVYRHGTGIEFGTYTNGTFNSLYTNDTGFPDSTDWIWLRLVKEGDDFSGFAWFDGDTEPVTFTTFWGDLANQMTDRGSWGVFTRTAGTYLVDFFGVGVNGGVPRGNDTYPVITNTEGLDGGIKIDWDAPLFTTGLLGYDIYVEGVKDNTDPLDVLTFSKTGLTDGVDYDVRLVAVYSDGLEFGREVTIKAGLFAGIFTDFTEYTDEEFPADWINVRNAADWEVNNEIFLTNATPSFAAVVWDHATFGDTWTDAVMEGEFMVKTGVQFTNSFFFLRADDNPGANNGISNNYHLRLLGGTALQLRRTVNNSVTSLGQASFSYTFNTLYKYKFQIIDFDLKAKVWPSSGSEPEDWTLERTDDTEAHASGYAGLGAHHQQHEFHSVQVEDLS